VPRSRADFRPGWRTRRSVTITVAVATAITGCGSSQARTTPKAPTLTVVASAYPLAQAASFIGGGKVRVTDLIPSGSNPFTFSATQTGASEVNNAGLFLFAGPATQPGLASLLSAATQKLDVSGATSDPYYWLDPSSMRSAVQTIETAMEKVDPAEAGIFRSGAHDLELELESTDIDYQSTLATCPRRTVFASDGAFAGIARRYNLDYTALGTSASPPDGAAAEAASVRSSGATEVFAETWIADSAVSTVASRAGIKVRTLDTLLAPPPGGWPRQATYLSLLEANLGRLSDALGCASSNTGP
jgi:zinc transport system substrate-binding protein